MIPTAVPVLRRVASALSYVGFVATLTPMVLFMMWGLDRTPPIEILAYTVLPGVHRGGYAQIDLHVKRNLQRKCSVVVNQYFQDLSGRRNYFSARYMGEQEIERLEKLVPGRTRIAVYIPDNADLGPGTVATTLAYACNPLHRLWPLVVHIEIPVVVDP